MQLGLQLELAVKGVVAKAVVQMAVGAQQVYGVQLVVAQIVYDGLAFFGVESTAVNDNGLQRFVADDVGVFLQHVAGKGLDVDHRGR